MRKIAIFYGFSADSDDIFSKIIRFFSKNGEKSLNNTKILRFFNKFSIENEDFTIMGFKNPSIDNMRGYRFDSIIFERGHYYDLDECTEEALCQLLNPLSGASEIRVIDFDDI